MRTQIVTQPDAAAAEHLQAAVTDAYQRLILPSLQNEVRGTLKSRADAEAIGVFQENLGRLLMSPPLGAAGILGLDPGLRTGCKLSLVDETGKYIEDTAIYPLVPRNDVEGSEKVLADILSRHSVKAIAVGNGTGSREATSFVRQFLRNSGRQEDVACVVVNEAGASVYSASKVAREEFPKLDVTVRGAISIARRLQDPLAELVKIDPKSIGVGQYQHDVDQKPLRLSLSETVESCVNRVGVDVNTASAELFQYVSGLNMRQARNMVAHRNENGRFTNRQDFLNVNGIGEKAFQQATGFLRIKDGDNVLDNTAVHPESYGVVEQMAQSLNVPANDLVANSELINSLNLEQFTNEQAGLLTLEDIREELLRLGRDPRDTFVMAKFRDDVTELAHLEEGMVLEGVVSNVTNFGAFVDIGVHQDGLVHISELSQRFVRDPREVVHVGQVVQVRVLGVDQALKRISLSMKLQPRQAQPSQSARKRTPNASANANANANAPRRRRKRAPAARSGAAPQRADTSQQREAEPGPELTMEEKLLALQSRFKPVDKG